MSILPFETDRVRLRPFAASDAERLFELSQEPHLAQYMPDQVYEDLDEARGVLAFLMAQYTDPLSPHTHPVVLAVDELATGQLIGHVGLSPLRDDVEIGYAIAQQRCGLGLATEAVTAVARWARAQLKLPAIFGVVVVENTPSWRVLEKAGFELVEDGERLYQGTPRPCRLYRF